MYETRKHFLTKVIEELKNQFYSYYKFNTLTYRGGKNGFQSICPYFI